MRILLSLYTLYLICLLMIVSLYMSMTSIIFPAMVSFLVKSSVGISFFAIVHFLTLTLIPIVKTFCFYSVVASLMSYSSLLMPRIVKSIIGETYASRIATFVVLSYTIVLIVRFVIKFGNPKKVKRRSDMNIKNRLCMSITLI